MDKRSSSNGEFGLSIKDARMTRELFTLFPDGPALEIENATFSWKKDSSPILKKLVLCRQCNDELVIFKAI